MGMLKDVLLASVETLQEALEEIIDLYSEVNVIFKKNSKVVEYGVECTNNHK